MTSPQIYFNPLTGKFESMPCQFNFIDFNINDFNPSIESEGRTWWNSDYFCLNVATGLGPVNQLGQETWKIIFNDTGQQIDNGKAVRLTGTTNVGGATYPTVDLAKADTHVDIRGAIFITTMDIPNQSIGICTKFGRVQGIDTTGFTPGPLWISPTTAGDLTSTRPSFPHYAYNVGAPESIAEDGVIDIDIVSAISDTFDNFWNGTFRESFDFRVTSNGSVITGTLTPANGHEDMTMIFSDGLSMLDTEPGKTIELTAGTDDNPQTNYIYIPQSTKVLTVSTSSWPFSEEHIRVAQVFVQSVATTKEVGVLRNQNWNDEVQNTNTDQGHLAHIGEKLRQFEAQWDSGVEGSISIGAGDEVWVKNTSGIVYQMHRQSFRVHDMTQYVIDTINQGNKTFTISGDGDLTNVFIIGNIINVNNSTGNDGFYTIVGIDWSDPDFTITVSETIPSAVADGTIGDDIHVVNSDSGNYTRRIDLSDETNDASGNPLNNTSFSVVVWGSSNKDGEVSHIFANMPIGTYNKNFPEQAVIDADASSVYNIPKEFQGTGFLIARFTFVNTGSVWSLHATQDLRGFVPNTTAGAGAGASGITTFTGLTDTPSSYVSQAGNIAKVNGGETALEFLDITTDWLSQYILADGSRPMTGNLDMGTNQINNVVDPTLDQDAATRRFVLDNALTLDFDRIVVLNSEVAVLDGNVLILQ